MGRIYDSIDPSKLTRSGNRCLEELVYIAMLSYDARISPEWAAVSCTTSVETHFNRLLEALISGSGARDTKLGTALLEHTLDDMFKNWDSRLRWLNQGFGIAISGDTEVQDYLSLVDLRNALVHGQGELTQLQQRKFTQLLALKARLKRSLGVDFRGSHVIINDETQANALRISRRVTMHVDNSVLASYKNLAV